MRVPRPRTTDLGASQALIKDRIEAPADPRDD